MGKASYKIRETKNMRHFTYSGNLEDAIEKAERDLQKEKENKEIAQWYWLYEKAKKAINAHNKKIANIEAFIRCAEEEQEKQKGKKDNETTGSYETNTVRSHYSGRRAGNHFVYAGYLVQRKEQRASNRRTGSSADAAGRAAGY